MSTELNLEQALQRREPILNKVSELVRKDISEENKKNLPRNDINEIGKVADKLYTRSEDVTEIEEAASKLLEMFESNIKDFSIQSRALEFNVAEESGRTVVTVLDKESKDIIRQIPSEEFIRVAEKLSELSEEMKRTRGVLFDETV